MTWVQRRKRVCRYCSRELVGLFRFDGKFCSITCRARDVLESEPFVGPVVGW